MQWTSSVLCVIGSGVFLSPESIGVVGAPAPRSAPTTPPFQGLDRMQLPVWSYTNLNDYTVCPKRFFHKHVVKDCPSEIKSQAQTDGIAVHEALKKRIKLREPLPEQFKQHEGIAGEIERIDGVKRVELPLGMTFAGAPCDFFGDKVWFRGRLDLAITWQAGDQPVALLVDWKTGKPWEDPTELRYQALLLRASMTELQQIRGAYVWLRQNVLGHIYDVSDTRRTWADLHALTSSVMNRFNKQDWPADEGPLCAFCPVSKAQCEHRKDPK
jgi:PD-(D/E)XK nuclease superfamily